MMNVAVVCQEMKWTYDEYMSQPSWFLTLLAEKMNHDGKQAKKKHGRQKS